MTNLLKTTKEALAGAAIYNKFWLSVYDFNVIWFSNRFVWRCPTHHILNLYSSHVRADHLDVGVGTGYYLDNCQFGFKFPGSPWLT